MPTINKGPCFCCQSNEPYPVSFRVVKIYGYYQGINMGSLGFLCQYMGGGDASGGSGYDVEITYSDGSTIEKNIAELYAQGGYDYIVTLMGYVEHDGYRGTRSMEINGTDWDWYIEQGLEKYVENNALNVTVDSVLSARSEYSVVYPMVKM